MGDEKQKLSPCEDGLLRAMQALDNQIARATHRAPAEREAHGVQKWQPIEDRIERVCAFILDLIGQDEARLDSVLVLAQAYTKALSLLVDELGPQGLGELRSAYSLAAARGLSRDSRRIEDVLGGTAELC